MADTVEKTVSLPPDLRRAAGERARAEGKTPSAVIEDALRQATAARRRGDLSDLQGYWSRRATERGILTEEDLGRYLHA